MIILVVCIDSLAVTHCIKLGSIMASHPAWKLFQTRFAAAHNSPASHLSATPGAGDFVSRWWSAARL